MWAREQELEADQGRPQIHKTLKGITVADIVSRYRDEVVPRKRGADRETLALNAFLRHPLARVVLGDVTSGMVSAYCALRLPAKALGLTVPSTLLTRADEVIEWAAMSATNPKRTCPFAMALAKKSRTAYGTFCKGFRLAAAISVSGAGTWSPQITIE